MAEAEGIPPTASTASVGLGLRYIGEHCYALSGTFSASTNPQTTLEFTTGAGYILGRFQFSGMFNPATATNGSTGGCLITFNEIDTLILKVDGAEEEMPSYQFEDVIIPPFTSVKAVIDSSSNDADRVGTVNLTGRVYDV